MKKLFSAAFAMTMLVIAATLTGSVLAAEPYVFNPADEGLEVYPVVYYDADNGTLTTESYTESTDSSKAYSSMKDAVDALKASNSDAGYIILASDYVLNRSGASTNVLGVANVDNGRFPEHEKTVILRGMGSGDEKSKIYLGGKTTAQGPLWFQNLDVVTISRSETYLAMQGYDLSWGTPGAGYNDVRSLKADTVGSITPVGASIIVGDNGSTFEKDPVLNFYSGTFGYGFMLSGHQAATTIDGDVTVNNFGCDMSGADITNGYAPQTDKIMGDLNINISGGKMGGEPALTGTYATIAGDINVTISGTPVLTDLEGFVINATKVSGKTTLNLLNYTAADKATVVTNIATGFDTVVSSKIYVSDNGDDTAAGTADAPVKTYSKALEIMPEYSMLVVKGTLTIDNVTEDARNPIVIAGAEEGDTIIINGDYTMGGQTNFDGINIKNGTNGTIVAAGNKLVIEDNVTTSPNVDGNYIDVIAGKRGELCAVDVYIGAGTYNNISTINVGGSCEVAESVEIILIGATGSIELGVDVLASNTLDFSNIDINEAVFAFGNVTKYTPKATSDVYVEYPVYFDGNIIELSGEFTPYVKVIYYIYAREAESFDEEVYPVIEINGDIFEADQALVVGEWAAATFNVVGATRFSQFTFMPYGAEHTFNEWNKMYVENIILSQEYDNTAPTYEMPEMTEDGDIKPYTFDPAEKGLEVLPVVYYSKDGIYKGDAEGCKNSLYAYGSLNEAISAIDKIGGGYVILLTDPVINCASSGNNVGGFDSVGSNNFASAVAKHDNMVILRGMDKKAGEEKINLYVGGMPNTSGPLWIQNLNYVGVSKDDVGFVARGFEFKYGTPGGGVNDVVIKAYNSSCHTPYMVIGGGDGGDYDKVDITIYSGTVSGEIRTTGGWSGSKINGDVNITIHGGDLTNATFKNGHSNANVAQVLGDFNLTITGGKLPRNGFPIVNAASTNPSYIKNNVTVKISGNPDISAMASSSIKCPAVKTITFKNNPTELGAAGVRKIDILDFKGNFAELKGKINTNDFDILNVNYVYLKDEGTGNGTSETSAMGNLVEAIAKCKQGTTDDKIYGGKIIICGDGYTIDGDVAEAEARLNTITITSVNNASLKFAEGKLGLLGNTTFKDITLEMTESADSYIVANGYKLVIDENVNSIAKNGKYVSIVGGTLDGSVSSVDVEINSGTFQNVISGDSVEGNVSIRINDGTINGDIVGGTSCAEGVIGGNVNIEINDGTIKGKVVGANDASEGVVEGYVSIKINGGTFTSGAQIIAANDNAEAKIMHDANIIINDGNFSGMADNNIRPGDGIGNGKTSVNYEFYKGDVNVLEDKIVDGFDVIVKLRAEKPVFDPKDKFMFIVEHYGDPTKALSKADPFRIIQSAPQTGSPIVVSPKQLNIKMDGSDHAHMSLQVVKDTAETIRFVPNHNPTKGSSIIVDGYNINGRGVNVTKYKYVEVVYYYTVPAGANPAVDNMAFRTLQDHSGLPTVLSTKLVPNQWTTAIFDLSTIFTGKSGDLRQYHFSPMGSGKKGKDVPVDQYIDIISMTFYTDKPNTTIKGGTAPTHEKQVDPNVGLITPSVPVNVPDISVDLSKLTTPVNSGVFTASMTTKDNMSVVEYIPNTKSGAKIRIDCYDSMGGTISLNEYKYATMKIYFETERTGLKLLSSITNMNGGLTENENKAQEKTSSSTSFLALNQWTTVTINLTPTDPKYHLTRQLYILPIGSVAANAFVEGEKFYIAEFVLSNEIPKIIGEDGEEEEPEVIEKHPDVIVDGAKLINSSGDYATFKSSVGQYDGKNVVAIKPNMVDGAVSIDGSAIFGNTEQTPDGALSLKKHRYAIISYYYETDDTDSEVIPEFELLGGRIQDKGNVANGVIAKGESGLVKNEWATAAVKLSGNGEGELTSGFTFRPFGNIAAENVSGDVLYIENITFVSNRP